MGTLLYMPPELLDGRHYNNKCDIWSLGCILYANANAQPEWLAVLSSCSALAVAWHGCGHPSVAQPRPCARCGVLLLFVRSACDSQGND